MKFNKSNVEVNVVIKIYRSKPSDKRVRQVISWLEKYNLEFELIPKKDITKNTMMSMLELSELGFDDILVPFEKLGANKSKLTKYLDIEKMSTESLIELVVSHPELLRDPITIDEKHLLVGYNVEEIRQFIPREFRAS